MRMHRLVTLLSVCLLAGCGNDTAPGSSSATADSAPPEACALLHPEDLQASTGIAFDPGDAMAPGLCHYASLEEDGSQTRQVIVRLDRHTASVVQAVEQYRDMMVRGLGDSVEDYTVLDVDDVGDHALWETYTGVTQLVVFSKVDDRHTDIMIVGTDGFPAGDNQAVAIELARRALQ